MDSFEPVTCQNDDTKCDSPTLASTKKSTTFISLDRFSFQQYKFLRYKSIISDIRARLIVHDRVGPVVM